MPAHRTPGGVGAKTGTGECLGSVRASRWMRSALRMLSQCPDRQGCKISMNTAVTQITSAAERSSANVRSVMPHPSAEVWWVNRLGCEVFRWASCVPEPALSPSVDGSRWLPSCDLFRCAKLGYADYGICLRSQLRCLPPVAPSPAQGDALCNLPSPSP